MGRKAGEAPARLVAQGQGGKGGSACDLPRQTFDREGADGNSR
jgi:hypothetical protein